MAFTEVFEAVFEAAALAAEATVAPILVAAATTSVSVLTTAGLVGIFVLLRFRLPETGLDFCSFSDLFNCFNVGLQVLQCHVSGIFVRLNPAHFK